MKRWKSILVWAGIACIPLLALAYKAFPNSDTLHLGSSELFLPYFLDWSTFIYNVSVLLIPFLVSMVLIVSLPRQVTPRPILYLLGTMAFVNTWFLWHIVNRLRYVQDHNIFLTIMVAGFVVFLAFYWRHSRKPTDREKKLKLQRILDQVRKEDLPAIFGKLKDIEDSAASMKEYDHVHLWREIFTAHIVENHEIILLVSEKLEQAKQETL